VLNALIGASSHVRDARTAAAAFAVVESESRQVFERAAALAVLVNYLNPGYIGKADRLGEKTTVQLAFRSHIPTSIDGTNPIDSSLRARIVALVQTLRTSQTPRELVELARVASLPGEK
jgi:hypothetical protein